MANARLQVDKAIFTALNVAAILEVAPGGVHNMVARQGTPPPFVVFQAMSKEDEHTFNGRFANMVYMVKAVAKNTWPKTALDVDTVIDTTLEDATLTISGFTQLLCRRQSDIYFVEEHGGDVWQHIGGLYRVIADQS